MLFLDQLTAYGRFAFGLRRFLQEPATADLGTQVIGQRLRDRDSHFLTLIKRAVYENERSPYLELLRLAGCDYDDLERMVRSDGIESTLTRLCDAGVYVTIDEFKGRQPIVRGGKTVCCRPGDFNNPFLIRSIANSSSGSVGGATTTTMNLDRLHYYALCTSLAFSAHRLVGKPTVLWMPILPSAAGLTSLLQLCQMGATPLRWFSPVAAGAIKPSVSRRLGTEYVVKAGRLFGTRVPSPEFVSGSHVHVVAECLTGARDGGSGCVVYTSPSAAVKVCQYVKSGGSDLSGVVFVVAGEPLTAAKSDEIRSAGARAVNLYAFAEGGIVGFGCAGRTSASDDIHVLSSSTAVIQHGRVTPFDGGTVDAFLFTSLLDKAAKILLNVESGDYGVLETRDCNCEFGGLGLTQHLHTIRSFDKLTGAGMTFVGTDLVRIVEEVLPGRFGGSSTDYQMVESEDAGGRTWLDIVASPEVGRIQEQEIVRLVLSELERGNDTNRMMAEVWRQGGMLRLRRERPHVTRAGKLFPLHISKDGRS